MKISLQIALGVFLGILAVCLVLQLPSMIANWRAVRAHQRAERIFDSLTPIRLRTACGTPDRDEVREETDGHYKRLMDYDRFRVGFVFRDVGGYLRPSHPDEYDSWRPAELETWLKSSRDEIMNGISCLGNVH